MKKWITFYCLIFMLCALPVCANELSSDLKNYLKTRFKNLVFKIDHSFTVGNTMYLPLIPKEKKDMDSKKKIEQIYYIADEKDKDHPKLILFSNGWSYVKLMKADNNSQTILRLNEIDEIYKEEILMSALPIDLVVPSNLIIDEMLSPIIGELNIKTTGIDPENKNKMKSLNTEGVLYLTSPDTGKIIYFDLNDLSMINHIQTMGAPWEIASDKTNMILLVTDFAKDKIYQLNPLQNSVTKSIDLAVMSSPKDIEVSNDGSLTYILESLANEFIVYNLNEEKIITKVKTPTSPANFSILKEEGLIAITCPATNGIAFLNLETFSPVNRIEVKDSPENLLVNELNHLLYITNRTGNKISVFDLKTKEISKTIDVGDTPVSFAFDQKNNLLYVGNGKSNDISIIDTINGVITDAIQLPVETQFPGDLEITIDGKWLIATSETTNLISIIDLNLKKTALKLDVGASTHAALIINKVEQQKNEPAKQK